MSDDDERHSYDPAKAQALLDRIVESRRDFEREISSRTRLLAGIHAAMEARLNPDEPLSDAEEAAFFRTELYRAKAEVTDLRRELGGTQAALARERGQAPQGPLDELSAAIDASWQRLYDDYKHYRRQVGYPGERKGGGND
ncbi:hypothetical protein FHT77_004855 [Rhizobium sp. BK181]|uniref:hypothetical protein n=1 Tax=Rhizobium sp. BK181 TaxID=2587072 RepID=UPI0016206E27|nr:hypothetical protein [Rhizobium sp. BK181]MBB3318946.1 hypothetical protein [Rhizobium sp. BK181]